MRRASAIGFIGQEQISGFDVAILLANLIRGAAILSMNREVRAGVEKHPDDFNVSIAGSSHHGRATVRGLRRIQVGSGRNEHLDYLRLPR